MMTAGCFPFRCHKNQLQLLLVQSSSDGTLWTMPGGRVKRREAISTAAVREVWEEAGAEGVLVAENQPLYAERKRGRVLFCYTYFFMGVEKLAHKYPEAKKRKRKWVGLADMGRVKLTGKGEILMSILPSHAVLASLMAEAGK